MKRILAFTFFLLFLAGLAVVNLKSIERAAEQQESDAPAEESRSEEP